MQSKSHSVQELDYNHLLKDKKGKTWDYKYLHKIKQEQSHLISLTFLYPPTPAQMGKVGGLPVEPFHDLLLLEDKEDAFDVGWLSVLLEWGRDSPTPHTVHTPGRKHTHTPSIPLNDWPWHSCSFCLIFLSILESAKAPESLVIAEWNFTKGLKWDHKLKGLEGQVSYENDGSRLTVNDMIFISAVL